MFNWVFRLGRQMLYSAMKNIKDPSKLQDELLHVDLYLDNVEVCMNCLHPLSHESLTVLSSYVVADPLQQLQGAHLQKLAERPDDLIIPLDIYEKSAVAKPLLDCLPGRRLTEEERRSNVTDVLGGRLFQGPEPSWIRKKRKIHNHEP
jgi:hypothetical protein